MMISPRAFHAALAAEGVDFLAGVPDSLLKEFAPMWMPPCPPKAM